MNKSLDPIELKSASGDMILHDVARYESDAITVQQSLNDNVQIVINDDAAEFLEGSAHSMQVVVEQGSGAAPLLATV